MIFIPIRTGRGLNSREAWQSRARRVKAERKAVAWLLRCEKPVPPCTVRLTRCAPSAGVDDDNLSGALKGVRDQVAEWLGVDDRDTSRVRYVYAQCRAPWGVRIEFGEYSQPAEFTPRG